MLRNALTAAALTLLVACFQAEDSGLPAPKSTQSSSSTSSGASGGTGGAGGASGGTGATGQVPCDDAETCGDYVNGCTGCAVLGVCAEHYEGCFGDEACLEYNKCLTGCKDDVACRDQCATSNPVGADRYGLLVTCIVCQVCPNSCADLTDFCP